MQTEILIVGGGLSGLALADRLEREGRDWYLVEAQDRLGGRILSQVIGGAAFDLGPAWFWPGQPRMEALTARLGLQVFEQFSTGALAFQDQSGAVHANRGYASMQGSLRLVGGMAALIDGLAAGLPQDRIASGTVLTNLNQTGSGIVATASGQQIAADRVVLAAPPRVLAEAVTFAPDLPEEAQKAMQAIPTWMAGHAKIIAVYDRPHWRDAGFSGDAMSHAGPMVEIHDASPVSGGPYALFGFVGQPAAVRAAHPEQILELAKQQLVALFGTEMGDPLQIKMQDWAKSPQVATARDRVAPGNHPAYGLPESLSNLWSGRVMLGSTETARTFGGFLEGALEAAEAVAQRLGHTRHSLSRQHR
jgi:monoamine oxidase